VPTSAYERAWGVARAHSFVVLTGPPEMGKSSIGWMVAMAQLANGWQVIECRQPDDVFETYDSHAKQVFLADDAFGRTEFSASKGEKWESDLAQVLQRVDGSHWLIWTSRKHILERAILEMDLQGKARDYPKPAEVLVQADKLTAREKALILYRHAANADLADSAKEILKGNLSTIVNDVHFTPERIRRFVKTVLPGLAKKKEAGTLKPKEVTLEVEKAIEQYTEMMEKSFAKLSPEHQWILITLLDEEDVRTVAQLRESYEQLCPIEITKPLTKLLAELDEGFIRVPPPNENDIPWLRRKLDWVHPSYRDLVIERLSLDKAMRLRYLEKGDTAAVTLALSQAGGASGEREFPLLPDEGSWETLRSASTKAIFDGPEENVDTILSAIEGISTSNPLIRSEVESLIAQVCKTIKSRWDKDNKSISAKFLGRFYDLSSKVQSQLPSPQLALSWETALSKAERAVEECEAGSFALDGTNILEWAEIVGTLSENEPLYLKKLGFPQNFEETAKSIMTIAEAEAETEYEFDTPDEFYSESRRFGDLVSAAKLLRKGFPGNSDKWEELVELLEAQESVLRNTYERKRDEEAESEEDDSNDDHSSGVDVLDLTDLFSDL